MKFEARMFWVLTAFFWLTAIGYGYWTSTDGMFTHGHTHAQMEWAGTAALVLSGGLMAIIASFFSFISRRIDPRPEDRDEAEISEAAGEFGFFSPGSYWPIGIAGSGTVAGIGLAFAQAWIVIIGVLLILFTVSGLLFEYYIGGRRPLHD